MVEVIELIVKVVQGGFGLRFVFSADYRRKTKARWKTEGTTAAALDIFETLIGIGCIALIVYFIVASR